VFGRICTVWNGAAPGWLAAKELWLAGCQSWVSTTVVNLRAMRLITEMTASPSGTAKAPPEQKSFWTSTTSRAALFCMAVYMRKNRVGC
jgi:hypothetical protein